MGGTHGPRQRVYTYPPDDDYVTGRRYAGHFSPEKAERFAEDTDWDGSNEISVNTGSQWDHQCLYRTSADKWVLRLLLEPAGRA